MKIIDRITEALGLYDEEDIYEDELEPAKAEDKSDKKSRFSGLFSKKNQESRVEPAPVKAEAPAPAHHAAKAAAKPAAKQPLFASKANKTSAKNAMGSRTIALPLADKQVKVVVLEPTGFDDSQKIADYLRNNQPVVVNFDGTDNVVTKRMTDFISGTIYALGGSMKKIGRSILVCAPKNVDIDAGVSVYDEKGGQPWNKQ